MDKYNKLSKIAGDSSNKLGSLETKLAHSQVQCDLSNQKNISLEQSISKLENNIREKDLALNQQREKEQAQLARMAVQYEKLLDEERMKSKSAKLEKDAALAEWEKRRAAEVEIIDSKMRAIFSKKDLTIDQLSEKVAELQRRVSEYESIMQNM